jgi:hypothetical protein
VEWDSAAAHTLRARRAIRWAYSIARISAAALIITLLSVPMPLRPLACSQPGPSNTPSPRLASVTGHNPATAPVPARRATSCGAASRSTEAIRPSECVSRTCPRPALEQQGLGKKQGGGGWFARHGWTVSPQPSYVQGDSFLGGPHAGF